MTVSVQSASVGSPADVVTQFYTLLALAGWTVVGTAVSMPGGSTTFSLAVGSGVVHEGNDGWVLTNSLGQTASISQKRVVGSPVTPTLYTAPTKLWIFSDPAPADGHAWCGGVIAFGYNSYRHFYFGYVTGRIGGFTGGEIVTGSHCPVDHDTNNQEDALGVGSVQRMFNGACYNGASNSGSVNVVHGANPNSIRFFGGNWEDGNNRLPSYYFNAQSRVFGGIGDDVNDGYIDRSPSMFAGGFALVPFNLYIDGPGGYFMPIGYAPGVRGILILDPSPETVLTIAGKNWQVFPLFQKSASRNAPLISGWHDESSWYFGLAYEVS
jgi:hypothetical protein